MQQRRKNTRGSNKSTPPPDTRLPREVPNTGTTEPKLIKGKVSSLLQTLPSSAQMCHTSLLLLLHTRLHSRCNCPSVHRFSGPLCFSACFSKSLAEPRESILNLRSFEGRTIAEALWSPDSPSLRSVKHPTFAFRMIRSSHLLFVSAFSFFRARHNTTTHRQARCFLLRIYEMQCRLVPVYQFLSFVPELFHCIHSSQQAPVALRYPSNSLSRRYSFSAAKRFKEGEHRLTKNLPRSGDERRKGEREKRDNGWAGERRSSSIIAAGEVSSS